MSDNDKDAPPLPDDFDSWWTTAGEWVEEPNQRRSGWSGMMRLRYGDHTYYIKKQCDHLCRTLRHPFGWPTASREYYNLLRLERIGVPAPRPVFHGNRRTVRGFEAVLVTEELVGYTDLESQGDRTPAEKSLLAMVVGRLLGVLHRHQLQHSSLYDKHIMVRWQDDRPEIALIDLETLRRAWWPGRAAHRDLKQLRRRQKIWQAGDWALLEEAHGASEKPGGR